MSNTVFPVSFRCEILSEVSFFLRPLQAIEVCWCDGKASHSDRPHERLDRGSDQPLHQERPLHRRPTGKYPVFFSNTTGLHGQVYLLRFAYGRCRLLRYIPSISFVGAPSALSKGTYS